MAIMLGFVNNCFNIIIEQKTIIDNMKNDIEKLYSKTEKNKKEIIGIRNDMTDYFHFEEYKYDDLDN